MCESPDRPAWHSAHGFQFTRRCLHLHDRAWQLGIEAGAGDMGFAGYWYDLSPHWKYMHAIGAEPRRMRGRSMEDICSTAAPKAFRKLFHADYQRWLASRDTSTPEQETIDVSAA